MAPSACSGPLSLVFFITKHHWQLWSIWHYDQGWWRPGTTLMLMDVRTCQRAHGKCWAKQMLIALCQILVNKLKATPKLRKDRMASKDGALNLKYWLPISRNASGLRKSGEAIWSTLNSCFGRLLLRAKSTGNCRTNFTTCGQSFWRLHCASC